MDGHYSQSMAMQLDAYQPMYSHNVSAFPPPPVYPFQEPHPPVMPAQYVMYPPSQPQFQAADPEDFHLKKQRYLHAHGGGPHPPQGQLAVAQQRAPSIAGNWHPSASSGAVWYNALPQPAANALAAPPMIHSAAAQQAFHPTASQEEQMAWRNAQLQAMALQAQQQEYEKHQKAMAQLIKMEVDWRSRVISEQEILLQLLLASSLASLHSARCLTVAANEKRTRDTIDLQWRLELDDLYQAQRAEFHLSTSKSIEGQRYRAIMGILEAEKGTREPIRQEEAMHRGTLLGKWLTLKLTHVVYMEHQERTTIITELATIQQQSFAQLEEACRQAVHKQEMAEWVVQFMPVAVMWRTRKEAAALWTREQAERRVIAEEQASLRKSLANSERAMFVDVLIITERLAKNRLQLVQEEEAEVRKKILGAEEEAVIKVRERFKSDFGIWLRWLVVQQEKQQRVENLRTEAILWMQLMESRMAERRTMEEAMEELERTPIVKEEMSLRADMWTKYFTQMHRTQLDRREQAAVQVQKIWRGVVGQRRAQKRRQMVKAQKNWEMQLARNFTAQHKALLNEEKAIRHDIADRELQDRRAVDAQFKRLGGEIIELQLMELQLQEDALRSDISDQYFCVEESVFQYLLTRHMDFLMRTCVLEGIIVQKRACEASAVQLAFELYEEEQAEWDVIMDQQQQHFLYTEQVESMRILRMEQTEGLVLEVNALLAIERQQRHAIHQHEDRLHTQMMELGRLGIVKLNRRDIQLLELEEEKSREGVELLYTEATLKLSEILHYGQHELMQYLLLEAEATERTGLVMLQQAMYDKLTKTMKTESRDIQLQVRSGRFAAARASLVRSSSPISKLLPFSSREPSTLLMTASPNSRLVADPAKMAYVTIKILLAELPELEAEARKEIEWERSTALSGIIDRLGTTLYSKIHSMVMWDLPYDRVLPSSGGVEPNPKSLRPRLPSVPHSPPIAQSSEPQWVMEARQRQQKFMGIGGYQAKPLPSLLPPLTNWDMSSTTRP